MILLFPGSFDPPHLGHLDIIQRAAAMAQSAGGTLLVAIADHPEKRPFLALNQRLALLSELCAGNQATRIVTYRGATVHFARHNNVTALVRGLRNPLDFENEKSMAEVNRSHGFDTIFFMTAGVHAHLSSHLVRSAQSAGLPVNTLVPSAVAAALSTPVPSVT